MPARSHWGVTPRESIERACAERGRDVVVGACVDLLRGGDADAALVRSLGGPHAPDYLDPDRGDRYWLRVWAARGLLWNWDDRATPALVAALGDEVWRVREMAAKVAARHRVDDAMPELLALRDDPVPRVRAAASRAVALLTA